MNVKVVMRSGVAALLALSLSACDVEQYINFILDPVTGNLEVIETPASWEESSIQNFGSFDPSKASQHIVLWNVDWDDVGFVIEAYNAGGAVLATSSLLSYAVSEVGIGLELEIPPGAYTAVTNFLQSLSSATRRVDFKPLLSVERLDPDMAVIVCVELYYDDFSLDFECEVLF